MITTPVLEGKTSTIWSELLKIYEFDTIATNTNTVTKTTFLKLKKQKTNKQTDYENITHYISCLLNLSNQLSGGMGESPFESNKIFILMLRLDHNN